MSLVRYSPVIKNKEAEMLMDVSGAWTSLTCYYTLHDKIVALQSENERLRSSSFVTAVPSEQYEKLKAENERLKDGVHTIEYHADGVYRFVSAMEYDRVKAENERLREAGDKMYRYVGKSAEHGLQVDKHDKSKQEWLKAKGGQS